MSSSIGELEIKMYADLARLRQDMDQARRVVGDSMKSIEDAVNLAKKAFIGLTGIASVNAFKNMVNGALEGVAALKDLQQATGASVESLSAMGAVGKLSDTSLQTIAGGMNKLSKSMATSTEDSRGAAAAIQALGLNYEAFSKLSPDQRMLAVSKAMAGFQDGADKSAAAMALFGKSGAELLPFLNDLAEKEELVGKVTSAQAEMADQYSDNLGRLNASGKAWQKNLSMGLLPALDETAQALLGVMNGAGGLNDQISKLAADGTLADWARMAVTGLSYVADVGQITIRVIDAIGKTIYVALQQGGYMLEGFAFAAKKALTGDFAGAAESMQKSWQVATKVGSDLGANLTESFSAPTLGQKLRENIAHIQAMGTTAAEARKKLDFKDTSGAGGAGGKEANPNAAAQDAAKSWADAYKDFGKMSAEAQAKTDDLSKAQARLVEYLHSTGYTQASEPMRQLALAQAYAAIEAERLGEAEKAAAKWMDEAGKANADMVDALDKTVGGLREQIKAQLEANAQIGLSEVAIAGLAAVRLEEAAAVAEQRAQWADESMLGDELVQRYKAQAEGLRTLANAKRAGAFAKDESQQNAERQKGIEAYLNESVGTNFAAGFDKASQSLGTFVQLFGGLIDAQDKYNKQKTAAAGDTAQLAQIEAHNLAVQINTYGSLAGAAKGFFKDHTAGYKVMEAAEKSFRAIELGMAIKNAAEKLGLITVTTTAVATGQAVETAAVVAGQAEQNAAKVPGVFMAFMSALGPWGLAAAAAAIAAIGLSAGSHGGSAAAPTNDGTGTVFGDPSAKSESVKKSLELLANVDTLTMRYSAQMLTALQSIDAKIGGVTNVLLRSGGITTGGDLGVAEFMKKNVGDPLLNMVGIDSTKGIGDALINAIGLGGVLDTVQSWWGGVSQQVDKAGVSISGALNQVIAGGGMSRFADVTTTEKSWFGLSKDTSNSTITAGLDPAIANQFGMILGGFADFVKAAAGPMGESLDQVKARLGAFVVDIGRVDFKGLTGTELQDKLAAVFGAEGDKIAKAALPGLEAFAKVGEGYLETVTRVATSTDLVRTTLEALGQSTTAVSGLMVDRAAAAMDLIDKFGGADKFAGLTSSYLQAYYTDAERSALTTKQLTAALASMGLTLPKSRDEFRKLVDAQNLSTEAGRKTYANLLGLADVFAKLSDATTAASSTIVDEIKRLRGLSTDASTQTAAQLQARFATATAQARSGDATALASLTDISKALDTATEATSGSAADAARMRAWLANSLTETLTLLGLPVPAFANGGMFSGGLAMVGERGPELAAMGPARIYSASQTQAMLAGAGSGDNSEMVDELRALRAEVASLRTSHEAGTATVAYNTRKTAYYLERVVDGSDAVRTTT